MIKKTEVPGKAYFLYADDDPDDQEFFETMVKELDPAIKVVLVNNGLELLQYLNRVGAATFLTVAQHGLVGDMKSPVDVTYLADTVILLRYFEAFGQVRRAISVLKKRTGSHENTIREFSITGKGLIVGPVLEKFQGVLRGVPEYVGATGPKGESL